MFRALLLQKVGDRVIAEVTSLQDSQLPEPERCVSIKIDYSTLNYKDGLAITHAAPVVRHWPMVAGIDGAGLVLASSDPRWPVGARVLVNGFGVGESHWGCLAERAALSGDWLVAVPAGLSSFDAMALGTAGYTAMLSVLAIEDRGVLPAAGPLLVTGASGGVGSVAVALLAKAGYEVVACTGKADQSDYLQQLGAAQVIDRASLSSAGKPLQKERYRAVVDCVGSHTLVNALAQTCYGGIVTACGLAQGMDLPASVAPFILRAIQLIGIDSVMAPLAARQRAWHELARRLSKTDLAAIVSACVGLNDAARMAQELMAGRVRGRVVVDVNS